MSLTKVSYSMINGASANVLDFGADPTGVADSTVAIQTAIDTGKSVYIPAGSYKTSSALTPVSNQIIYGDGQNVTIIKGSVVGQNGFTVASKSWVYIEQLSVTSTATSPTGAAINVSGGGNNFITDVRLGSFFKGCLFISTGTLTCTRMYISGNGSHGIQIGSTGTASVGIWMRDIYSLANGGDGIVIVGNVSGIYLDTLELAQNTANGFETLTDGTGSPSELFVTKAVCDSNGQSGFLIGTSTTQSFFTDCWSSNRGTGYNFYCQGTNIQVMGGKFYNCNGHGMQFLSGSRCSVIGATIQEAGTNTADTYDGIHSSISGLVVSGVIVFSGTNKTRYGVYLNTGSSNVSVTGCNLTGNVSGGLFNATTSTTIYVSNSIGTGANDTSSWTPTINFQSGGVGSFTYTTQTGNSTRNGNMVFCDFDIVWTGSPTAGSVAYVSGFPISISPTSSVAGSISAIKGVTFTPTTGAGTGTMINVDGYTASGVSLTVSGSGLTFTDATLNGTGFGGGAGKISGSFYYLTA